MATMQEIFKTLSDLDISKSVEKKETLNYLSWANAWTLLVQNYPDSNYTVYQYDGKPYIADSDLGYMIHTSVTIEGNTIDMYLPVLNHKNKAMLNRDYTYTTRYGDNTVNKATMFDINTSIMRCLVKNIALFGLGLSLYRGEDIIPQEEYVVQPSSVKPPKPEVVIDSETFYNILKQVPNTPYDKLIKMVKAKYEVSEEVELALSNAYIQAEELEEIILVD